MLAEKEIDAEMSADWAKIQEKYALEEPETPEQAIPAESPEAPQPRDELGRFGEKESKNGSSVPQKTTAPQPRTEPSAKATPETSSQANQPGSAATPPGSGEESAPTVRDVNRPPSSWKPTVRQEWEKLPPAVRAEIHRREADFQNGQSQLLPDARFGAEVQKIVAPYRMLIEAEGATPERAIADLLRTAAVLRVGTQSEKLRAIVNVSQQYGIDLRPLTQQQPSPPGQPQPAAASEFRDPRVDQLITEIRGRDQAALQTQRQNQEAAVTQWMNEVDAQGAPKRPYLGDVINDMSALTPQIRQVNPTWSDTQVLEQAYERAIWAHPEVRQVLQGAQQTELQQQQRADHQTRVRDAKRAASVNVPRRASTPSPGKPGSMDDTLRETARELGLIT